MPENLHFMFQFPQFRTISGKNRAGIRQSSLIRIDKELIFVAQKVFCHEGGQVLIFELFYGIAELLPGVK